MRPIVNGITKDYADRIDVREYDALGDGKSTFESYRLQGHPSFVLTAAGGAVIWQHVGPRTRNELADAIDAALK